MRISSGPHTVAVQRRREHISACLRLALAPAAVLLERPERKEKAVTRILLPHTKKKEAKHGSCYEYEQQRQGRRRSKSSALSSAFAAAEKFTFPHIGRRLSHRRGWRPTRLPPQWLLFWVTDELQLWQWFHASLHLPGNPNSETKPYEKCWDSATEKRRSSFATAPIWSRRRDGSGITGMLVQMGRMGGLGVGYLLQFFGWGWVRGTA